MRDGGQRDHRCLARRAAWRRPILSASHRTPLALCAGGSRTAVWFGFSYGIPALAKQVAFRLPASTERLIGADALRALDETLLGPSTLAPDRVAELQKLFSGVTVDLEGNYSLELRAGRRLGANALALPSGIIVLTDELVKLADDDRQIVAVLAHELGHMQQRHALRSVLQNSTAAVLFAVAVGDLTSVTSLAAALPTMLLQAKYSRQFETEADEFALAYLAKKGIPPDAFASLLKRLDRGEGTTAGTAAGLDYFSTHPATRDRVERAKR